MQCSHDMPLTKPHNFLYTAKLLAKNQRRQYLPHVRCYTVLQEVMNLCVTSGFDAYRLDPTRSGESRHTIVVQQTITGDHFDILAFGKTDVHCKFKETLFIQELKPSLI